MNVHRFFPILALTLSSLSACSAGESKLQEIRFGVSEVVLEVGETYLLEPSFTPSDAKLGTLLSWTSSAPDVASVSKDGLVTALSRGNATISATSNDYPDIVARCAFTISDAVLPVASDSSSEPVEEEVEFNEKTMDVHRYSAEVSDSITCFYRTDKLELLPYVNLSDYYSLLLGKDIGIEHLGNGVYDLTSASGTKATLDTKANTLSTDDLMNFVNTTIYRQEGVSNTYFDGSPFIRIKETVSDKPAEPKLIDFQKYGIDIVGIGEDVYLPLVTASNLFSGPTMVTCFYDENNLYFVDPSDLSYDTSVVVWSESYIESIGAYFPGGKRSEEQAEFSYGELCFYLDTFYGHPGRESLHDDYLPGGSLDETLKNGDGYAKKTRELLKSQDKAEYFTGLELLDGLLSDAGHTVIDAGASVVMRKDNSLSYAVAEVEEECGYSYYDKAASSNYDYDYMRGLAQARLAAGIDNLGEKVSGDTVLYTFDSFMFEMSEWESYYRGERQMPEDELGNFKRILDKYKDSETIKNVVLNISANGGGYGDLVFSFMGLMCGESYLHYRDMTNGNICTTTYEFDANSDGEFDEADKEVHYDYNFGILSSACSFSCGNFLPLEAMENGIMLLGDKSGGGACAVLDSCSAEGLYVRISSPIHMIGKNGEEYDRGVPCDTTLVTSSDTGYDFSSFFDLNTISSAMNEFYATK